MRVRVIHLSETEVECCICGEDTPPTHAVGYCCGPTRDEIGTESTEYPGHEVGGMPACQKCHDEFYS